ncbi:MAG TPA: hypothetical protein VNV38_04155 [Stellaceae bacterium]|jgi:hypothetical protein|nr:hypothetical protein [Stellaceae bacterium]
MAVAVATAVVAGVALPTFARVVTSYAAVITIPPATLPLPAPHALMPTDLRILHDPQGTGLALYGALTDKIDSASSAVLALMTGSDNFDPAPVAQLLLADEGDRHAQALFTALVHGAPVIGVAVATLGDPSGDVTLFYDTAGAFSDSFPRLRQALAPGAAVEIGISDNSVYEADSANDNNADANWNDAIAALAKGGDAPIDAELAHSLADRLASDTSEKWRIIAPATFR